MDARQTPIRFRSKISVERVLCRAIELAVLTTFAVMIVFAYCFVLLPVALHILKIGLRAGKLTLSFFIHTPKWASIIF